MPELAVYPLAAALHKVFAQRMIRLVIVAGLRSVEDVRRQFASRSETLFLALRAVEELTARPVTFAILEIVAESVFLHGVVLRTFVKVLAALPPVTDISQKISADPIRGVDDVNYVRVQSARHPDRLLVPRRPAAFQLYFQFFHRRHIAIVRWRYRCTLARPMNRLSAANTRAPE